jgi:hypothetical protein
VSSVEHLFILYNSRILEFAFDGAELVIGIQGFSGLGESRRVGILKIPKLGSGLLIAIATIVVAVGGNLCEVLKSGEVGLAFSACGFAIL